MDDSTATEVLPAPFCGLRIHLHAARLEPLDRTRFRFDEPNPKPNAPPEATR